jgi:VWFA-related protein
MSESRVSFFRRILPGAALIFFGSFIVFSKDTPRPAESSFSADVEVVNAFVTVRDKKGTLIKDLAKEDFTISEDGKPQAIEYFSRETNLPLTIGLIVDTTGSESNMLEEERLASRTFLYKILRPGTDNAFLMQFGKGVELLQELTSETDKFESALNLLKIYERSEDVRTFNTLLADAISLASDKIMKSQQGRKALIVLGDGFHVGDHEEMAIKAAQEADTLIYTIRIRDKKFHSGGSISIFPPSFSNPSEIWKKNLQRLSQKTGGMYFELSKTKTLKQIYSEIEEELRSQYSLGYTPGSNANGDYRRIKIDVKKKDLAVRGRDGYYLSPRSQTGQE